jgi:hypothetical protein
LADWIASSDPNAWVAPLSTIDLLASSPPSHETDADDSIREPTRDNIQEAFDSWRSRFSHPDSIAIFYFCGHGVYSTDLQILLASDFGRFAGNPFQGAFELKDTRQGFLQTPAGTQCFFIDACRSVSPELQKQPTQRATALCYPDVERPTLCRSNLTLHASAEFERAFAPAGGAVSYFGESLLLGFKGAAANCDENGDWVVGTDEFVTRSAALMKLVAGGAPTQRPTPGPSGQQPGSIYRLPDVPESTLTIWCEPEEAHASAGLTCEATTGTARYERLQPGRNAWSQRVPSGNYRVRASFPDKRFRDAVCEVYVLPPEGRRRIQVSP